MAHFVPDVELVQVDLDSVDGVDDNAETIVFDIVLNLAPAERWKEEFEILYQRTPFSIKPPVVIEGDRMTVHFLPRYQRELQTFLDFLGDVVHRATEENRKTEAIKVDEGKEENKRQFRSLLSGVRLPAPGSRI